MYFGVFGGVFNLRIVPYYVHTSDGDILSSSCPSVHHKSVHSQNLLHLKWGVTPKTMLALCEHYTVMAVDRTNLEMKY